ncbi:Foldase protein PrsA precursor [Pseudonocardia sp. Ae168_Ps1]|uniref:peptidylprolyl isomerase n=1 Tax=unclassified Pseudonocardia TaxID=2619320 RepID=UPI000963494D|nr:MULTISPECIES: peptidyl-prolyl cis-trans isomerase [unclassified Pseudonocardia]OLL74648.1 Foldase protein PrsA precursor [Pseudonocardia sp. Ae150A_Ps1]OLL80628.1 Foldase protein PrsA precursor [Pseudonocardia sp. Ae168_Ps1]OLL85244.1 Foldase protein PrsA precursor [Pseudonocardia sp. Ae263_Ps1]OLL94731.1 Foldase protein PrsA precursor [Pseudonocardia sp. Ae356_Ps1]
MRVKSTLAWTAGEALHAARSTWPGRIVAAVLVLAVVAGVGGGLWWQSRQVPDGAALAVGERVVTVPELDERVQTLRALYGVELPTDDPARMDGFRRDAAKAVAVSMVLEDRAAELGVGVADAKVRQTLDQYVTQQLGPGPSARDEFVTVLGNVGTSEDKVLGEIRQQMAVGELFNRVTEGVTTSDDDLRAAFPQYAQRLGKPESRELANIVVTNKEAADRVAAELRGGGDFAAAARANSIDNATRDAGGAMGTVSAEQLQPEYAKAAFGVPSGQVFGPVQNQFGWNVGRVGAVTPGVPAEFDQVKDKLRQLVDFDRRLAAWGEWMTDSLSGGDVRYADDYRPVDPDSAPTGGTPGLPPGAPNTVPPAPGGGG